MNRTSVVFIPQVPMQRLYRCTSCHTEQSLWRGPCPSCGAVDSRGERRWVNKEIDLTSVSEYGDPVVVWPSGTSLLSRETLEDNAVEIALKYNSHTDYIIALGSPTLIAILAWAIGERSKVLRLLEWDKRSRRYHPTLGKTVDDVLTERT